MFQVTANSDGSWTCLNTRTGEHFTAPTAADAKLAIEAYNQGLQDKEAAAKAEAEAAAGPVPVPDITEPIDQASAVGPAPVSNAN